jgi:hypothetical protein
MNAAFLIPFKKWATPILVAVTTHPLCSPSVSILVLCSWAEYKNLFHS